MSGNSFLAAAGCILLTAFAAVAPASAAETPATKAACVNFFDHANGAWEKSAQIAPDEVRTGSFNDLREASTQSLLAALEQAASRPDSLKSDGQRLALHYFKSGTDRAAIERAGTAAVQPLLAKIDALTRREQLPALLGELQRSGIDAPWAARVMPDARDKRRYRMLLFQSGLGLPDRDDYFRDDERTRALRAALATYQGRLLALSGSPAEAVPAQLAAQRAFETRLAEASMTRVAMRDPAATYNLRNAKALAADKAAPTGFDWSALFVAMGMPAEVEVNIAQPQFATAVARLAAEADLADWRVYLRLALLHEAAPRLPAAYADAHFAYMDTAITGAKTPKPRGCPRPFSPRAPWPAG
jgi:putative endopeptidase